MSIICGPETATISFSASTVCNKSVAITDIKSGLADRIDLSIDGNPVLAFRSGSAVRMDNEIWTIFLISKNVSANTASIRLTISSNPCVTQTCPDQCIGTDLWSSVSIPVYDDNLLPTGCKCDKNALKTSNSPVCLTPTHYISIQLSFVPPEVASYFSHYIDDISNNLLTYISPPPSPWAYQRTTYDAVNNAFIIWLYLPPTATLTMSPGALDDITDWVNSYWTVIVGIALFIIGLVISGGLIAAIPAWIGLVSLAGSVSVFIWGIHDAKTKEELAETIATNLTNQLNADNKENTSKQVVENAWIGSTKAQSDCLVRLNGYKTIHDAKLNGYITQYSKYADLVTRLTSEISSFDKNADAIISDFKTKAYSIDVCNTYIVSLDNEINASNIRIADLLATYAPADQAYSIPCKGWSNQSDCEKAECYWYDGECHVDQACWLPIAGTCLLSARTGKIIVSTVIIAGILGAAYWLVTRHQREVGIIYRSARESVSSEAERARSAYQRYRPTPPQVPALPSGE